MPDTKITDLSAGNPAQSGDELPINRSGTDFKVTAGSIASLATSVTWPQSVSDGAIFTSADNSDETILAVTSIAAADNYITITNATSAPQISATGADTNIQLNFSAKGGQDILFLVPGDATVDAIKDVATFRLGSTGTVDDGFGGAFVFDLEDAAGDSTTVADLTFSWIDATTGIGRLDFHVRAGVDVATALSLVGADSAVNYLTVSNAAIPGDYEAAGTGPSIAATGSETGIYIDLLPKVPVDGFAGVRISDANAAFAGTIAFNLKDDDGEVGVQLVSPDGTKDFNVSLGDTEAFFTIDGAAPMTFQSVEAQDIRFITDAGGVAGGWTFSGADGSLVANGSQFIEMNEMTAPAAPAANKGRTFFQDNGAGKTQYCVRFATGAITVIATEP